MLDEKKIAKQFGTVTAVEIVAAEAEIRQFERLEAIEADRLAELTAANPDLRIRAAEAKKLQAQIVEAGRKGGPRLRADGPSAAGWCFA